MRARLLLFLSFVSLAVLAQTAAANKAPAKSGPAAAAAPAQQATPATVERTGIDAIMELVKANMSETLVIKTIQRQSKPYDLTPQDLLKLQKAGVSQKIIETMLDPTSASSATPGATPAATPAPPAGAAALAAPAATTPAPAAEPVPVASTATHPQPSAAKQKEKKGGGLFGSLKNSLGQSAQKTVDGLGNTVDKTVDAGKSKVDSTVGDAVEAPAKAAGNAAGAPAGSTGAAAHLLNAPAANGPAPANPAQANASALPANQPGRSYYCTFNDTVQRPNITHYFSGVFQADASQIEVSKAWTNYIRQTYLPGEIIATVVLAR
jgi:hypothetical protein